MLCAVFFIVNVGMQIEFILLTWEVAALHTEAMEKDRERMS